jgi:SulP family sulfate permease
VDRPEDPVGDTTGGPAGVAEALPEGPAAAPDIRNLIAARVRRGARAARGLAPAGPSLRTDAVAGLTGAIGSVPDGMAGGVLAGVNPVYGLYASLLGPIVGGLFASTELMLVTTTSAAAIAAGQAVAGLEPPARDQTLFLIVLLIGVLQVAAGLLRLGNLTRFVSHSVMIGFLSGVAVLIILGQLGTLTGTQPSGPHRVAQALDLLRNLRLVDPFALATGLLTLALAATLPRTRLGAVGLLLALVVPSVVVAMLGWGSVELVESAGPIPRGIPLPALPQLSALSLDVVTTAVAVAVVILVQGAGVSQSVPNPGGRRSDPSRDFLAQGLANVASGLFRGLPVGGSVGQTALNVTSGAQTRWAAIISGVWMLLIVLVFAGPVGKVAMPSLAALLIFAAANALRVQEGLSIWRTGWASRAAALVTFVATLFLPIQVAIGLGALLSALLHTYSSSADISLVELVELPDGRVEARPPPARLASDAVTILGVDGGLFYAGAWTLERLLPTPGETHRPAVVLRLRGQARVGATFIDVVARYAEQLGAAGGRLYLAGVDDRVRAQLARSGKVQATGPLDVYAATSVVGESTRRAAAAAAAWLATPTPGAAPPAAGPGDSGPAPAP